MDDTTLFSLSLSQVPCVSIDSINPVRLLIDALLCWRESVFSLSDCLGLIPCGHTYCTKCLSELCAGSDTVICPQCRKQHDVPTAGINQFPRNLSYQQLLDIRTEQLVSTRQCQVRPTRTVQFSRTGQSASEER